jgi:hypothetical protein
MTATPTGAEIAVCWMPHSRRWTEGPHVRVVATAGHTGSRHRLFGSPAVIAALLDATAPITFTLRP